MEKKRKGERSQCAWYVVRLLRLYILTFVFHLSSLSLSLSISQVRSEPDPINIAYTPVGLDFHQDMPYYESPPGLQMLHCMRFDANVVGGESTFLDALTMAEILQEQDPEAFEVLCTIPASFQKDHLSRADPVQLFWRRPHIATDEHGDPISVFWSPPFEGPLQTRSSADTAAYVAMRREENKRREGACYFEVPW